MYLNHKKMAIIFNNLRNNLSNAFVVKLSCYVLSKNLKIIITLDLWEILKNFSNGNISQKEIHST